MSTETVFITMLCGMSVIYLFLDNKHVCHYIYRLSTIGICGPLFDDPMFCSCFIYIKIMLSITTNIDSQKIKQQTSNISIFSMTCKTHYSLPLVQLFLALILSALHNLSTLATPRVSAITQSTMFLLFTNHIYIYIYAGNYKPLKISNFK